MMRQTEPGGNGGNGFTVLPDELEQSGRTAQQTAEAVPGETGGILAASDGAEHSLRGWQTGSELNSCTDEWKSLLDGLSREMDAQGDRLIRTAANYRKSEQDAARTVGTDTLTRSGPAPRGIPVVPAGHRQHKPGPGDTGREQTARGNFRRAPDHRRPVPGDTGTVRALPPRLRRTDRHRRPLPAATGPGRTGPAHPGRRTRPGRPRVRTRRPGHVPARRPGEGALTDIRTLQDTRPDDLFATADAYARLADAFAQHTTTWSNGVDGRVRNSGWTGNAADRAGTSLLLAMSTEGQGRAALSFGNPDTADDVVAYVPGLGTKVGNVGGGDGDRAEDLWRAAHSKDPSRSTASIVWLGYDAPQKDRPGLDSLAVAGTERGEKGGEAYQGFLQGLRASHEGQPAHLTALGHSYGSFTLGQAAQRPGGIPVDDIIIVGSPGTGARRAGDLGIDPSHVWVGAAENDPVSHLPGRGEATGIGAGALAGVAFGPAGVLTGAAGGYGLGHVADPHALWFGQDPASADFGANRFAVADGPQLAFDSHSDYWKIDGKTRSASLDNMADIVSGRAGQITRQEQR